MYGEYVGASSLNDCLGYRTRHSVYAFIISSIAMYTQIYRLSATMYHDFQVSCLEKNTHVNKITNQSLSFQYCTDFIG